MRAALRSSAVKLLRVGLQVSGGRVRGLVAEALTTDGKNLQEVVERVESPRGTISFHCLGELPLWRARTLLTKEPETIEWIDSFEAGDTYWDVGANIGIYSLYAAISRKVRVLAFEPSASNYLLLNRNIELNGLAEHLQAYCLAFSDVTRLDRLNMLSTEFGGALSSFGIAVDNFGNEFKPRFQHGAIGFSIDGFVDCFKPPFPNHIKIDVDGIEDRIIAGATVTLNDPRLKSISIELDDSRPDFTKAVSAAIEAGGLMFVGKRHGEMFQTGRYKDLYNYQFRRMRGAEKTQS